MELEWLSSNGTRQAFTLKNAFINGRPAKRIRPNEVFELNTPFHPLPGELLRKPFSEGDKVADGSDD
jgi:hypothetical protein